jgi:predicted RNA-binding Zn-ribbon protein involved in translation (DUF1610 family)
MLAPGVRKYNYAPLVAGPRKRDNVGAPQEATLSDRKYRQRGYQDSGQPSQKREASEKLERPVKKDTFGPRAIQMPGTRTVSRCSQCGTLLQSLSEPVGQCPKCGFELHSCKQCTYFDTSNRFECTQPIPERIPRKDQRNECTFYSIRVMIEKETSTPKALRPNDARQAFENLFKK